LKVRGGRKSIIMAKGSVSREISSKINGFLDRLEIIVRWIVIFLILFIMVIVAFGVFSRFFLRFSFSWELEMVRLLTAWLVFIGASISVRRGEHIALGFIKEKVDKKKRLFLTLLANVFVTVFLVWVLVNGIRWCLSSYTHLSPVMQISMTYSYLSLPVGLTLVIVDLILTTVLEVLN
jgi:TRAP-type C4-dicarboxylate transport system permease small subunit